MATKKQEKPRVRLRDLTSELSGAGIALAKSVKPIAYSINYGAITLEMTMRNLALDAIDDEAEYSEETKIKLDEMMAR